MTDNNSNNESILETDRRSLLIVMSAGALAGCTGNQDKQQSTTQTETNQPDDTITIEESPNTDNDGETQSESTTEDTSTGSETTETDESDKNNADDSVSEKKGEDADNEDEKDGINNDEDDTNQDTEDESDNEDSNGDDNSKNDEKKDDDSEDDEINNDEEDDNQDTEDESDNDEDGEKTVSAAAIVKRHNKAIQDNDYELEIELQGEDTDETITKNIAYKENSDGSTRVVSIEESTTQEDGVKNIRQLFTDSETKTKVEFEDGTTKSGDTQTTDIEDAFPVMITGGSVMKQLLGGATIQPTDETASNEGVAGEYKITEHNNIDVESGVVVIEQSDIINTFSLTWLDSDNVERWINIDVTNVGSVEINRV